MNFILTKNKEKLIYISEILILSLAYVIFHHRFSSILINSDSYVYLLQAKFFDLNHTFSGYLGTNGDFLSPIFYRGGLSFFIYLIGIFLQKNYLLSAQFFIQSCSFLTVITIFLLVKKVFHSHIAGFLSGLLIIFSYSFSYWSTVIMPEIPTIFLVSCFLFCLFSARRHNIYFIFSPLFLGLAILFRGEMILLFFPIIFIFLYQKRKIADILYFFFIILAVWGMYFLWLYQSSHDPSVWLAYQLKIISQTINYHHLFLIAFFFLFVSIFIYLYRPYLIILLIFPLIYYFINYQPDYQNTISPLYSFFFHDAILIIFGIFGLIMLISRNKYLGGFFLFSLLILLPLYFSRGEYRYYVHLILFLVIPAGFFLTNFWHIFLSTKNKFIGVLFLLLIISGEIFLYNQKNFLPTTSYEQTISDQTKQVIKLFDLQSENTVICSVFSESMFFTTNFSTIDCFDGLNDLKRKTNLNKLIVIDEDISRHQPEFVSKLQELYPTQPIYSQWVVVPYQEKNSISFPKQPTKWYFVPAVTTI